MTADLTIADHITGGPDAAGRTGGAAFGEGQGGDGGEQDQVPVTVRGLRRSPRTRRQKETAIGPRPLVR
jgi:hypothetical protein